MANEPSPEGAPSCTGSGSDGMDQNENGNALFDGELSPDSKSKLSGKQQTKRKYRTKDKKLCGVCGDKALGYNFDAISCESCKAFFRRNALKRKIPDCPFLGECKIDLHTRRFCSKCRLEKCLQIGMKRDMILDETEKKVRIEKMRKNREQRLLTQQLSDQLASPGSVVPPSPSTDSDHPATPIKQEPPEIAQHQDNGLQQAIHQDLHDDLGHELTQGEVSLVQALQEGMREHASSGSSNPFTIDPSQPQPMRTMSTEEEAFILYLSQAYTSSFQNITENPDENSTLNHLVNYSGLIVRKLIKFAKKVDDFIQLDQESQIWLLKGVVLSTLFLRSAEHYCPEKDAWITPTSAIKTIVLKRATGYGQFHEEHMNYCKSVKPLTQDDPTILTLLQLIALFYPDRPNIPNRELISDIQDKYICYLKHYLESRYSYRTARYLLPKLMGKMNDVQELAENHGHVLLHVNPSEIEPLMLEIFDLK